eukprot:scaffold4849_cov153-Amphora_coffeaeformis.AAC.8
MQPSKLTLHCLQLKLKIEVWYIHTASGIFCPKPTADEAKSEAPFGLDEQRSQCVEFCVRQQQAEELLRHEALSAVDRLTYVILILLIVEYGAV